MQFRKVLRFVKRKATPSLVAAILLVSPLSLCAQAAVWEGTATIRVDYWGAGNGVNYQMSSQDVTTPISSAFALIAPKNNQISNGLYFYEDVQTWTSAVDVYMGGYLRATHSDDTIVMYGNPYEGSNYEVTYRGTEGSSGAVLSSSLVELTPFTPTETLPHGGGISIRAGWMATEAAPISQIRINPQVMSGWQKVQGANYPYATEWVVTSLRVISADTSAELDELSNVADQIIAGNQILEAMKGEVVGLLQQIYIQTGDIEIAATKTNELLTTLLGYVDGLEGQLNSIYTTLTSFTTQLIKLLQSNNQALLDQIQQSTSELTEILNEIRDYILEDDGGRLSDSMDKVEQGSAVQEGLNELQKPDYEDFTFNTEDTVDQFDGGSGESNSAFNGFMKVIFRSDMITTMMTITLSFAMVAYVLYGKR